MHNYRVFCIILFLSLISIGYSRDERVIEKGTWQGHEIRYVAGEIIVGMKIDTPEEYINAIKTEYGEIEFLPVTLCGIVWIKINSKSQNIFPIIQRLEDNDFVEYVEPNIVGRFHDIYYPDDPYYEDGHQWPLRNIGQNPPGGIPDADIDAEEAWDIEKGDTNTVMAILDGGIPLDSCGNPCHPDLCNHDRIIVGPNFCGVPNITHGTHVAGIAGAETNNSEGIAGVCGRGKLLIMRINYEPDGWSVARAIAYTVDYVNEHPNKRAVINFSGGWEYPINLIEYALWYADRNDVVFVAACDNDCSMGFPAGYAVNGFVSRLHHLHGYPNVIAVGASDPWDNKAWYSTDCGTVLAPGGFAGGEPGHPSDERDVFSTIPDGYGYLAGCSMAAPHVTGVAGLMLSANPSLSDSVLRHIIAVTADDQGNREWNGHSYPPQKCGRLNAYKSVLASIGFPVFVGSKDYEINAGEYLEFEVWAYDLNHAEHELDYSVVGQLPLGAEFSRNWPIIHRDQNRGGVTPYIPLYTFRWTPTIAQIGLYSIVFRVEDPEENTYEDTITIDVKPPDNSSFSSGLNISSNEPILVEIVQHFTTVQFTLDINQMVYVTLEIYDITGRLVTSLLQNEITPGTFSLYWNGKDMRGRNVSNGIYYMRLDADGSVIQKKIVMVR
jgi:thermitase